MSDEKPKDEQKSIYDVPMDLPGDKKPRKLPKLNLKKLLIVTGVIVIAAALILVFSSGGTKQKVAAPTNQPTESTNNQQDVPEADSTKSYDDSTIGLKLTYPDTWKLTKAADNGVRLESPTFSYQTTVEEEVKGNFRIYIRTGARSVDGKYIGRGLAIKPSEKLSYSDPLSDQRKTTFLSSFGLDKTDNFAFFLIAGNFELKKGDSLGPDYGQEPETFIVAGGYSDTSLKDDLATNPVPADTYTQSNAYTQAIDIVKSLQLR